MAIYYVNPSHPNAVSPTTANGQSVTAPWASIPAVLDWQYVGDTLRIARGQIVDGFSLQAYDLTLEDYDAGTPYGTAKPRLRARSGEVWGIVGLRGGFTANNIHFVDAAHGGAIFYHTTDVNDPNKNLGGNTFNQCEFSNVGTGLELRSGGGTVINDPDVHDLIMVKDTPCNPPTTPCDSTDYGAVAFTLATSVVSGVEYPADGITINNPVVERTIDSSFAFTHDGGFIEIFGDIRNVTVNNMQINLSKGILEVGGHSSTLPGQMLNFVIDGGYASNYYGIFLYCNDLAGNFAGTVNSSTVENVTLYDAPINGEVSAYDFGGDSTFSRSPFFWAGTGHDPSQLTVRNCTINMDVSRIGNFSPARENNHWRNLNGAGVQNPDNTALTLDTGEIKDVDAQFADAPTGDFTLAATSPLIGAGTTRTSTRTTDTVGNTWPSPPDIGGYAYVTAGATTSITPDPATASMTTLQPTVTTIAGNLRTIITPDPATASMTTLPVSVTIRATTTITLEPATASMTTLQPTVTTQAVGEPAPAFTSTTNGLRVTFSNATTGASSFAWDFKDGASSTLANPTHTYSQAGVYPVTLTATGAGGTASVTNYVLPVAIVNNSVTSINQGLTLWAVFYNADWSVYGEGPLWAIQSASVTRSLDGPGKFKIKVMGSERRALDLVQNERRMRLFVKQHGVTLELTRGICRTLDFDDSPTGSNLVINGPDVLDLLQRQRIGVNRQYDDAALSTVVTDLIADVPGWSVECASPERLSLRMDTISVFKALTTAAGVHGQHVRLKPDTQVVQVGAFGDDAGLLCINIREAHPKIYNNRDIAIIETISESRDSAGMFNRVFAYGAGQGVDASLTMQTADRNSPYAVKSRTKNGRTEYYIEDTAAQATYGVIESYRQYDDVAPLSNSDIDIRRAANAVYDMAVVDLQRHRVPVSSYRLTLRKVSKYILPGDKIRVRYVGRIQREDGKDTYKEIDTSFWVLKVTTAVADSGVRTDLEISSVDEPGQDVASEIVGELDAVTLKGVTVQPSVNHYLVGPEQVVIDNANPGEVQLIITDATFQIDRVLMRVRTQPFTATAKATGGGGAAVTTSAVSGDENHTHVVGTSQGADATAATRTRIQVLDSNLDAHDIYIDMVNPTKDILTSGISLAHSHEITLPTHTHDLEYGIYRDTQRPAGMQIRVNGVTVANSLGTIGVDADEIIDITDAIRNKSGGFRATHVISITAGSGQGEVLITFDVYETITPFRFGS